MKSNNSIKTGKNFLSKCLKSLALFFKSIPTFFLNLISPAKLQTSQITLKRSFGSFLLIPSDSNAEDATTLANDASLSIALSPSNLDLNLTPTPSGTLSAAELGITINTTNSTGYTLSLASGNSTSTALTNTNSNITENNTINSTTATTIAILQKTTPLTLLLLP